MKIKNAKNIITKTIINSDTFIKVLTLDGYDNPLNVDVFYKVNNKYKKMNTGELPKEYVNRIATNKFENLNNEELNEFESFMNKLKVELSQTDINCEKTIFGNILYTNYIITKSKDVDYYTLQNINVNEFGVITSTTPIVSAILPYVCADIINLGNTLKKQIFLIESNIFVQLLKTNNSVLGLIYQFEEDETSSNAKVTLIGVFNIVKDFSGCYEIQTTQEDINKITNIENIINDAIKQFTNKLSLQISRNGAK